MNSPIDLVVLATFHNFNEQGYLAANSDVIEAVESGDCSSGYYHFVKYGYKEGRKLYVQLPSLAKLCKLETIRVLMLFSRLLQYDPEYYSAEDASAILEWDTIACEHPKMAHLSAAGVLRFLEAEGLTASSCALAMLSTHDCNDYSIATLAYLKAFQGVALHTGSGACSSYWQNVINYDMSYSQTVDVRGWGDYLPFHSASCSAIFGYSLKRSESISQVRNGVGAAEEAVRVLVPGGRILIEALNEQLLDVACPDSYSLLVASARSVLAGTNLVEYLGYLRRLHALMKA